MKHLLLVASYLLMLKSGIYAQTKTTLEKLCGRWEFSSSQYYDFATKKNVEGPHEVAQGVYTLSKNGTYTFRSNFPSVDSSYFVERGQWKLSSKNDSIIFFQRSWRIGTQPEKKEADWGMRLKSVTDSHCFFTMTGDGSRMTVIYKKLPPPAGGTREIRPRYDSIAIPPVKK